MVEKEISLLITDVDLELINALLLDNVSLSPTDPTLSVAVTVGW